ncbi:MAG: hypothetical protein A2252_02595 [Elusimicrobia bacterium RIFOXYA2_FULL_39_19]|nr:MAG: hypothetical protein A2252_02595 [Elusimicrobia bacterium RIFOXYA2_FULL_39_19]
MKTSDTNNQYLSEVNRLSKKRLTNPKDIKKLWKRIRNGDKSAEIDLIEGNLGLVFPIARKYQKYGIDVSDLIEEGNIGLIHAIKRYNPRKKAKFSTYAVYWIKQFIRKSVEETSKDIRIPTYIWENLRKWIKNWESLHSELGRYPTINEMTLKLNLSTKQIRNIIETIEMFQSIRSLEAPIDEDGDLCIKDIITDKSAKTPDLIFTNFKMHDDLLKALDKLNPRERTILSLRYGLDNKNSYTLEEIGKKLKISKERVRQLEKRALYQLKWIAQKMNLL